MFANKVNKEHNCDGCGCTLGAMSFEEELAALNEYNQNFSEFIEDEISSGEDKFYRKAVLCEECYQKFMVNYRSNY